MLLATNVNHLYAARFVCITLRSNIILRTLQFLLIHHQFKLIDYWFFGRGSYGRGASLGFGDCRRQVRFVPNRWNQNIPSNSLSTRKFRSICYRVRGTLNSMMILFCNTGVLVGFLLANYLDYFGQIKANIMLPTLFLLLFTYFPGKFLVYLWKNEKKSFGLFSIFN